MRRVRAAGGVVDEERFLRIDLVEHFDVRDRVVGHGRGEVPFRIADVGIDRRGLAEQVRLPLAGVAADEAVEVIEAHADRPAVERPGLARLERRHVVVLAEPRGGVAVVLEDAADGRAVFADDAVVAGKARGYFGDHAETRRVVVAAGDQRRARRRAERGGMELRVAQPRLRDAIQGRRRDDAAERARRAEADVVGHDQQHVGRALGRHDGRRPVRLRLIGVVLDDAAELRGRRGELFSVDRRGGARRARHAGGFGLCIGESRNRNEGGSEHPDK